MAHKAGPSKEAQHIKYKTRYEQNRRRRITRAIKLYPENEQLKTHLASVVYRRYKPSNKSTTLALKHSIELLRVLQKLAASKKQPNRAGLTFIV